MGRLLKKKDPSKKTKKAPSAETPAGSQDASAAPGKPPVAVKKPYTPVAKSTVAKDKNVFDKSIQFLREVKVELKKVTWPSRKQTMGSTVVVMVIVAVISLFLGVVDAGLSGLIRAVLH